MDFNGATRAAVKLMTSTEFASSAPFITSKVNWQVQINGVYNLLFPYMHTDYAVRLETVQYVQNRIQEAMMNHNSTNKHNGALSTPGINVPILPTQIIKTQMEKQFIYKKLTKNGLTTYAIMVKIPTTPTDLLFTTIGYGL